MGLNFSMEFIYIYSIPAIISFLLMNKCYKKGLLYYPTVSALICIIPFVNWIGLIYFIITLKNGLA